MSVSTKPCMDCNVLPKVQGKHKCYWCALRKSTSEAQARAAIERRKAAPDDAPRTRPRSSWPEGMRWCGGCRAWVGLKYCGSSARCHGCQIVDRRERSWGLSPDQQATLYSIQGGRCAICRRNQQHQSLAVDHSHYTGDVRGLGCGQCNQTIGVHFDNIDWFLSYALYLLDPPARRVGIGEKPMFTAEVIDDMTERIKNIRRELGYI